IGSDAYERQLVRFLLRADVSAQHFHGRQPTFVLLAERLEESVPLLAWNLSRRHNRSLSFTYMRRASELRQRIVIAPCARARKESNLMGHDVEHEFQLIADAHKAVDGGGGFNLIVAAVDGELAARPQIISTQ